MKNQDTEENVDRFAFLGPSSKNNIPEGGFCISIFALIRKKEGILFVRPQQNLRWEEWAPNWSIYDSMSIATEMEKWRLPSSYVKEGESPEEGLRRVMEDQLGASRYSSEGPVLLNFYEPSRRYPGKMHWDYCFVFEVSMTEEAKKSPW
jgi:ADP-ribose pyrophosphatase YjhB (NUDIX family)